tara:strand:- start:936 stop:4898 length:3963 start_codon:yes stop_codon:yes gene_type:complete
MAFSDLYKQGIKKGIEGYSTIAKETIKPDARSYKLSSGVNEAMNPSQTPQTGEEEKEGLSMFETALDIASAPLRGAYEAFESTAELITGQNYDLNPLGESKTMVGGFVEGMSQFVVGFIPGLKVVKGVSYLGKAAKGKFVSKFMKGEAKHQRSTLPVAKSLAKTDPKGAFGKIVGASAFSDFVAFEGQEARLSDLVQNTRLANPLTEFLQYEGNEDDSEYMGRFKNVMEGAVLEGITGGLLFGLGKGIKGMKAFKDALAKGKTPKEAEKAGAAAMNKTDETLDSINTDEPSVGNDIKNDPDDMFITEHEKLADEAESFGIDPRTPKGKLKAQTTLKKAIAKAKKEKIPKLKKAKRVSDQELAEPMYLDVDSETYKGIRKDVDDKYKEIKPDKIETGGIRAVLSSLLRGVADKSQMQAVMDDYVLRSSLIKDKVEISEKDFDRILDNSREIDYAAGADGQTKLSVDAILKGEDVDGWHEQWLRQNAASYEVMREAGEIAVGSAKKWADAGLNTTDGDLYREFIDSVTMYELAVDVNAQRARRDSKALLQRKFLKNKFKNKKVNPVDSKMDDLDYTKFLYERLGTKDPKKLAKQMSVLGSFDDLDNLRRSADLAEKTSGRRLLDITQEYWINSILSGPATQVVNLIGNALTGAMLSAERGLGAAFSGNTELLKATFNLTYTIESFKESLNAAAMSFRNDDSILIKGSKQFDDTSGEGTKSITAANVGKTLPGKPEIPDNSTLGAAINGLGTGTRFFTRLLTTGDEFFKNLAYRKQIRTELAMDAYAKIRKGQGSNKTAGELLDVNDGIQSTGREMNEVSKYVEKNLNDYITESGHYMSEKGLLISAKQAAEKAGFTFGKGQEKFIRDYLSKAENKFDKDATILDKIYKRSEKAVEFSELATHTSKIESDSIVEPISRILTKHPVLKFVVPFLRTPANILKFGYERTPFGLLKNTRKEYWDKLRKGTDIEKADARGKLALGSMTSAATVLYLMSGKEFITGGGPRNRNEADALKQTGWQPYSVKVGDKYYSYQRLDPLATMMQMSADFSDYLKYEVRDDDDRNAAQIFGAMSLVYAVNMTDKTFLKGVNNMLNVFRDPEYYGPKLFKDISGGFVPNLVNQARNTQSEIMVKEAKNFSDTLLKRVPGLDKKVAPKRNVIGEEIYRENPAATYGLDYLNVVNPFYVSKDKKDVVFNEIAKTRHGYTLPSRYLFGVKDINLEEVESNVGKYDTYDRLQELMGTLKLEGRTLRQTLKKAMSTKEYQSIPNLSVYETTGEKSPKIDIINGIIQAYKSKARAQVLQENPELLERYKQAIQAGAEAFTPQ